MRSEALMLYDPAEEDGWFDQTRTRGEQKRAAEAFVRMDAALTQMQGAHAAAAAAGALAAAALAAGRAAPLAAPLGAGRAAPLTPP